jgi:hypothetical protein
VVVLDSVRWPSSSGPSLILRHSHAERGWGIDEAIERPEYIHNQVKPSKILDIASKLG